MNNSSAEILKREARLLRGHYGEGWKNVLETTAKSHGIELSLARRTMLLQIIEPTLGYSIKQAAVDNEDAGQMRRID